MMIDKIKDCLKADWMENALTILTIICTVASLWLGVFQLKETIQHESMLAQKSTMLEQTKKLPRTMQDFLRKACLTIQYKIEYDNTKNEEYLRRFTQYNEEQIALLEELTELLVAYGSEEAISIFSEFYYPLREYISGAKQTTVELSEWLEMYYSLPLLMSVVKYDTTGEIVNPCVFLEFLMPQFENTSPSIMPDLIEKNDELVKELGLGDEFLWRD